LAESLFPADFLQIFFALFSRIFLLFIPMSVYKTAGYRIRSMNDIANDKTIGLWSPIKFDNNKGNCLTVGVEHRRGIVEWVPTR
jgi:hypothetical protein